MLCYAYYYIILTNSIKLFLLKLEEEIRRLKEGQKRTTQLELRFQRERESWRRERNDGQRRLSDSLSTRRMENSRIEGILAEVLKKTR